jgi:phosphatidylglycerophosphatase C
MGAIIYLMSQEKIAAIFDFDGTLTYYDTFFRFLLHASGSFFVYFRLIPLLPKLILFSFSRLTRQEMKEAALEAMIGGKPLAEVQKAAQEFVRAKFPKALRPKALEKLQWHQSQGHLCIIASANLALLLEHWTNTSGIQALIATELEISEEGKISGKIAGINCWGKEKVRRLELLLGDKNRYKIYAYGDSRGDWDMLKWSDFPHYRPFRH